MRFSAVRWEGGSEWVGDSFALVWIKNKLVGKKIEAYSCSIFSLMVPSVFNLGVKIRLLSSSSLE